MSTDDLNLGPQNDGEPADAPVVDPPEPGAGPEGAEATKPPEKPAEEPEKPRKGGFQRKIERLEEQNRMLQGMLVGRGQPPVQEPEKPQAKAEPKPEQFDSFEDYQRALRQYDIEQATSKVREDLKREQEAEAAKRETERRNQTAAEKLQAAREKYPDLEEKLADCDAPLTQAMQEALFESPAGADLLYHLANHPEEAHRIARLSPLGQVREMTLLEAKLGTKTPPKPSAAPAPPSTVKGAGAVQADPSKMSDADWLRAQRKPK